MLVLKCLFVWLVINFVVLASINIRYEKKRTYDLDSEMALLKKRDIVARLMMADAALIIAVLVMWFLNK